MLVQLVLRFDSITGNNAEQLKRLTDYFRYRFVVTHGIAIKTILLFAIKTNGYLLSPSFMSFRRTTNSAHVSKKIKEQR